MSITTRRDCEQADSHDPLGTLRDRFLLPDGVVYLLGNSLGPLTESAAARVERAVRGEWGEGLLRSWHEGWWDLPSSLGARLARLIGAGPDEVLVTDSTSVDLYKVILAAAMLRPGRRAFVTVADNFPTDLYMLDEAAAIHGDYEVRRAANIESLVDTIDEDVAVVELTHVDYRTARVAPMAEITKLAHDCGALVIWDLSHSIGAVPVDLGECEADFAVGCTYKYLNGGPGSPAFVFAASRLHSELLQPIPGWHGHARPFAFEPFYDPAPGIRRFASGSPPILSLAALAGSLDVWDLVDLGALFEKSRSLSELLIVRLEPLFSAGQIELASPRDVSQRGSHVALRHRDAEALVASLASRGVLADFREPDFIRLGIAPLYLRHVDIWDAAEALADVVTAGPNPQSA